MIQNWEMSMTRLYISPCLVNLYAEYIMQNARLDEAQAGIKIAGRKLVKRSSLIFKTIAFNSFTLKLNSQAYYLRQHQYEYQTPASMMTV